MVGREKMEVYEVLRNDSRRKIVSAIEKWTDGRPSIADLEKNLNMNRGTLKHHLKILERHGVIGKEKLIAELGAPLKFFSKRKGGSENLDKHSEEDKRLEIGRNKEKILKLLGYIERNKLSKKRVMSTSTEALSLAEALERSGYLDSILILTEKGKRLLESLKYGK